MFTINDTGCYADGAFGHDHVRGRMADLLERLYRHHPRGGDGAHWQSVRPIVESLRGDMPDDAWDEDEGLEWLNSACYDDTCFAFVDGDLVLLGPESEDE